MRVLFAGTAGVRKSTALMNLSSAIEQFKPTERVFKLNGRVPLLDNLLYGRNPTTFFQESQNSQKEKWRNKFIEIRKQFDTSQRDHHFLGMHLTYRYEQFPNSIADFGMLRDWNPDCIVTFVDDIFLVRARLHNRDFTSFTLSELLAWRAEEILAGDLLARTINPNQPPPNFVLAVTHSAKSLGRLLLNLNTTARLYMSHNIADVRDKPSTRSVIDTFRTQVRLKENCFVFEPLTIDEFSILGKIPGRNQILKDVLDGKYSDELPQARSIAEKELAELFPDCKTRWTHYEEHVQAWAAHHIFESLTLKYDPQLPEDRWPVLNPEESLVSDSDLKSNYPLRIPIKELMDAKGAIEAQVPRRDIRLVDQSHYLIVYRPTLGGEKISTGVFAEIQYANHSGIPVIWYVKRNEDAIPKSPFVPKNPADNPDVVHEATEEKLWNRIDKLHQELDSNRNHFLR